MNLTLQRRRQENVAFLLQYRRAVLYKLCPGKTLHRAGFHSMSMHRFDIQSSIIDDRPASLDNGRNQYAVLLGQKFGSVEAHITQSLHHNAFAFQTAFQTGALHIIRMPKKFTQPKLHPAPCSFSTPMNATVLHRLASHAAETVDILGVQLPIFIGHPGHFTPARTHIRRRHIQAGTHQTAFV